MLEALLKSLALWLHLHPNLAGLVTCLITFIESLAILGFFIPGSLILSTIGGLIGSGVIPALTIFTWAIVGAILGDSISYWFGYRYHHVIRRIWPISRFPKLIAKGEIFFYRHGGKSIFIGRFIGAIRPMIPLIAGMLRLRPTKFFIFNVLSAIIWAPAYMAPGILIGAASAHFAPRRALHFIFILLLSIFILWLLFWLSKLFLHFIIKHWGQLCDWLWQKLRQQQTWLYTLLYEHEQPLLARPLSIVFFTFCGTVLFLLLVIFVQTQVTWLKSINLSILSFFESLHTPFLQHLASNIGIYLGEASVILASASLLALYLISKRDWHALWYLIALMTLAVLSIEVSKLLTHSLRPQITFRPLANYSFPSGHTAMSFALFGYITFLIAHNSKRWIKLTTYSITTLLIVTVAISRLYLNVHWLSDVIGSLLLSGCLLGIIVIAYRRKERQNHYRALPLILILVLGQIIFGTWYYHKHAQKLYTALQLQEAPHYVDETQWWNSPYSLLPIYRNNRFEKPIQVLNIQWLGSLSSIKQSLLYQGWRKPIHISLHALKQQLLGKKLIMISPTSHRLRHHKAVLILIKPLKRQETYLILQLWGINYHSADGSIYVGNISYHFPKRHWLSHHDNHCQTQYYTNTLSQLEKNLGRWEYKTIDFQQKHKFRQLACTQESNKILLIH